MKISNIDTLSAYIDRLITERIKWYFFKKEGDEEEVQHQKLVILAIRKKIAELIQGLTKGKIDLLTERRTFHLMNDIEKLIIFDTEIGESDRARLELVKKYTTNDNIDNDITDYIKFIEQEERLRTANELRSKTKNQIDELAEELF